MGVLERRPTDESQNVGTEDAVLVTRAKAGDADAFGEIYERYVDRLYCYVAYRVANATDAEDLAEQVFLKAWEAIGRYEDRGLPLGAWLFRLAHNLVIDSYRLRRSDVPLSVFADTDDSGLAGPSDPPAEIGARFESAELHQAICSLNEEQRQVVLLRFVEGLSHGEVATIVGNSEGATRAVQHRALLTLARLLSLVRGTDEGELRECSRGRPRGSRTRIID